MRKEHTIKSTDYDCYALVKRIQSFQKRIVVFYEKQCIKSLHIK